jgi:hypothetical protein
MDYKRNVIACGTTWLLGLCLVSGCASVQQAVAVDCPSRPVLPVALAREPPPEGTALKCLQELSQGLTSAANCSLLRSWQTN